MQPAASHAQSAHACGLSSVFSEAHVPEKNAIPSYFATCGRQNSAEGFPLCKRLFASCIGFGFFDSLNRLLRLRQPIFIAFNASPSPVPTPP